ncbi:MAG TPA: RDD family protein [Acidimicrobiia bacterium]|jgi:hypothetical protein|nr:RDD family protein [Acidimicrobiia bacterium]
MAYAAPTTYDPTNVMGRRIAAAVIDAIPAIVIGFFIVGHALTRVDNVSSSFCDVYRSTHGGRSICIQPSSSSTAYYGSDFRTATLLFSLVYWFAVAGLLQGATGATFGKHMVGLRVVDRDGNLCGMGKAILRTVVGYFEVGFCILIGGITALATRPHRRIGDFAAGTYVVARESVGTPIGTPPSAGAYPPPWSPPNTGWGPPPAGGQTWGTPTPAPGWGQPPQQTPPPQQEAPRSWGAPPPTEAQPQPESQPPTGSQPQSQSATDAPGWAAPTPTPATEPQPQAQPDPHPQPQSQPAAAAEPSKREPQWDAQRNAWVYWEAETNRWLQHDPKANTWGPLR